MERVIFKCNVRVDIQQSGPVYVANCKRFGVLTQGCTREEAKANIIEALTLFFETCFDMGTLEEVLASHA